MRGVGEESSLRALAGRSHITPSIDGYDSPTTISCLTLNPGHIPWPQFPGRSSKAGREGVLLDLQTTISDEPLELEPTTQAT